VNLTKKISFYRFFRHVPVGRNNKPLSKWVERMVGVMAIHLQIVAAVMVILFGLCNGSTAVESPLSPRLLASKLKQKCIVVGKCEMCTPNDLRTHESCKSTGRRQQFLCSSSSLQADDGEVVN